MPLSSKKLGPFLSQTGLARAPLLWKAPSARLVCSSVDLSSPLSSATAGRPICLRAVVVRAKSAAGPIDGLTAAADGSRGGRHGASSARRHARHCIVNGRSIADRGGGPQRANGLTECRSKKYQAALCALPRRLQ
ncbi:hypothetical protein MTO96_013628 [Rhipicephalus appendiculatus]